MIPLKRTTIQLAAAVRYQFDFQYVTDLDMMKLSTAMAEARMVLIEEQISVFHACADEEPPRWTITASPSSEGKYWIHLVEKDEGVVRGERAGKDNLVSLFVSMIHSCIAWEEHT